MLWIIDCSGYQSISFDFTKAFPFIVANLAEACHLFTFRTVSTISRRIAAFHANEWHLLLFFLLHPLPEY